MKTKTVIGVIIVVALLLLVYLKFYYNVDDNPSATDLGDVMSDFEPKELGFESYDDGDEINLTDKIKDVEHKDDKTFVTMKSYSKRPIIFDNNITSPSSSISFEDMGGTTIHYEIHIMEHEGIEHIEEMEKVGDPD